jgi:hypothetical protein
MANMIYCRFENTYRDLQDCRNNWDDENSSEKEKAFRAKLLTLCTIIYLDNSDADEDSEE